MKFKKSSKYYDSIQYIVQLKTIKTSNYLLGIFKSKNLMLTKLGKRALLRKNKHKQIEKILRECFPDIPKSYYLAKYRHYSEFIFYKNSKKIVGETDILYHLTAYPEEVLGEGLKARIISKDNVRYSEPRIYFSLKSYAKMDLNMFSNDGYLNNRYELRIKLDRPIKVYVDPEYDGLCNDMVYSTVESIPNQFIDLTGYNTLI